MDAHRFKVRLANKEHAPFITRILNLLSTLDENTQQVEFSQSQVSDDIEQNLCRFVIVTDLSSDKNIAMCMFYIDYQPHNSTASVFIDDHWVDDEYNGHGFCTLMLARVVKFARWNGLQKVRTYSLKENTMANEYYRFYGFREWCETLQWETLGKEKMEALAVKHPGTQVVFDPTIPTHYRNSSRLQKLVPQGKYVIRPMTAQDLRVTIPFIEGREKYGYLNRKGICNFLRKEPAKCLICLDVETNTLCGACVYLVTYSSVHGKRGKLIFVDQPSQAMSLKFDHKFFLAVCRIGKEEKWNGIDIFIPKEVRTFEIDGLGEVDMAPQIYVYSLEGSHFLNLSFEIGQNVETDV